MFFSVSNVELIVCFRFDPATWIAAQDKFAALVVREDQNRERKSRKPPVKPVSIQEKKTLFYQHIMAIQLKNQNKNI